jgi:hypothetical protein
MKKLILLASLLLPILPGCRSLTYRTMVDEKGNVTGRELIYNTFGVNVETEGMEVETPQGKFKLAKQSTDTQPGMDLAQTLANKIPNVYGGTSTQNSRPTVIQVPQNPPVRATTRPVR